MKMRVGLAAVAAALLCGSFAMGAATDEVSLKRAQTLYADKNYKDALTMVNQLLQNAGTADRYALYMLKGEASIQLEEFSTGVTAFGQAQKETTKVEEKGMAYALETLLRRSPRFEYVTRINPDKSYDIKSMKVRKDAIAALLADEIAATQKRVEGVKNAGTPAAVAEFGRALAQLSAMEIAVTTKSDACDAMAAAVNEQFKTTMDKTLTTDEGRVKTYSTNANAMTTTTVDRVNQQGQMQRVNVPRRTGPTDSEIAQLKGMLIEVDKLRAMLTEMTKPLLIKADDVAARTTRLDALTSSINTILNTDYTKPAAGNGQGQGGTGTPRQPRGGNQPGGTRGGGAGGAATRGATGG